MGIYNAKKELYITGIELTFFSGVYGTCISNNSHFGSEAKGLLGISGMFIGVGEILGELSLTKLNKFLIS